MTITKVLGIIVSQLLLKAITFPTLARSGERGDNLIHVGEKCRECKYWSRRTETCDYRLRVGSSRCVTNNKRISPSLCDKFKEGESEYDKREWQDKSYKRLY